jgi:hypothetical protein
VLTIAPSMVPPVIVHTEKQTCGIVVFSVSPANRTIRDADGGRHDRTKVVFIFSHRLYSREYKSGTSNSEAGDRPSPWS